MKKEIKLEDIIEWIILNNEDRISIDKINSATFPFTSKYLDYSEHKKKKKGWRKIENYDDAF